GTSLVPLYPFNSASAQARKGSLLSVNESTRHLRSRSATGALQSVANSMISSTSFTIVLGEGFRTHSGTWRESRETILVQYSWAEIQREIVHVRWPLRACCGPTRGCYFSRAGGFGLLTYCMRRPVGAERPRGLGRRAGQVRSWLIAAHSIRTRPV